MNGGHHGPMAGFQRRVDATRCRYTSRMVTLEQRQARRPPVRPDDRREALCIAPWHQPGMMAYLALFHAVGDPWLWHGRLELDAPELQALLADPAYEIYRLTRASQTLGLLEIDRRTPRDVEIAYFGLLSEAAGRGLGSQALADALDLAWLPPARRVWLHTCSEDHPAALRCYLAAGFEPVARQDEWITDPRCRGLLPRDCGPHVPLPCTGTPDGSG